MKYIWIASMSLPKGDIEDHQQEYLGACAEELYEATKFKSPAGMAKQSVNELSETYKELE